MPYTMNEIHQQMEDAGAGNAFNRKKAVRKLTAILSDDESIKYACWGFQLGRNVLCVCTNRRVIMLTGALILGAGAETIEIPLDKVNSVTHTQGLVFGQLDVTNGANTIELDNIAREYTPVMANIIEQQRDLFKKSKSNISSDNGGVDNTSHLVNELRNLKTLADQGVITQEEFKAKKKQLLGI